MECNMKPVNTTYYLNASEDEKLGFRNWLNDHLHYGPVTITFKKKDGTERVMNCTLKESDTLSYEKKTDRVREYNEEVCPVFDLDKKEWRSFRYDSITEIRFDL